MSPTPYAKKYTLACNHIVWYVVPPLWDDYLWCVRCRNYQHLYGFEASGGNILDVEGEFRAEKIGKRLVGFCLHQDCHPQEQVTSVYNGSYDRLRMKMHTHYMRSHTKWKITVGNKPQRLPKNSPPPF